MHRLGPELGAQLGGTAGDYPVARLTDEQVRKIITSSSVLEHTTDIISIVMRRCASST